MVCALILGIFDVQAALNHFFEQDPIVGLSPILLMYSVIVSDMGPEAFQDPKPCEITVGVKHPSTQDAALLIAPTTRLNG